MADGINAEFYHLGRKVHFLLAPLIAIAIYRIEIPVNTLLTSVKIGLIVTGLVVFFQYYSLGVNRTSGMFNANIFGDIVVVFLYLSIVNFVREGHKDKLLSIVSSFFAVFSVILSGNRGSVILLLVLGFVYLYFVIKKYFSNNLRVKTLLSVLFLILSVTILNQAKVKSGLSRAYDTVENWTSGNQVLTSSGIRLALWKASFDVFQDYPVFGVGYRNTNRVVANYVDPSIASVLKRYSHLHNEYITNLISAGLLGLFSLMLLLLLPLRIYIKQLKDDNTFTIALMGVILGFGYIGFGFTHIALGEEHVNAVFIFFTAIILPRVVGNRV
jgi:O-antigen ligase